MYKAIGVIEEKGDVSIITDRFSKRDFVISQTETSKNGKEYVNYIRFQLINDNCDLIDNIKVGESVEVSFDVKGRKWEKEGELVKYFINCDAWDVKSTQTEKAPTPSTSTPIPESDGTGGDDLPF